jgi:2-(1,2-epoxy-1,2-dihydrophenyl)acetyl-CoA isomerase
MTYEQLIVDRDGAVATVRLNYPEKLNALSETMLRELLDELGALSADRSVRAIVLTGEGRGFCVGADLAALQDLYSTGEKPKLSGFLERGYNRLIPLVTHAPKPVVAAVNGVAAGAGMSLALACDLRIASDAATFTTAFVRIGLVPDSGMFYSLPRAVGAARALELAITSDRVDAATALAIGLVNRVVPAADLAEEARALAERLADMPTTAVGLIKGLFHEGSRLSLEETMHREAELQDRAAATADHMEGVRAFLEKRAADFTGA